MRIAITGVGGTGKTTLGKLIEQHTDLRYINDRNDDVLLEMGYESGDALFKGRGEEGMVDWHVRGLANKIEKDEIQDNYILEKTVIDSVARWFLRMSPEAKQCHHEAFFNAMRRANDIYDRIIFLPLDLSREIVDNGMRTTDPLYRQRFDWMLRGVYDASGIDIEKYDFDFSKDPKEVIKDLGL
jgi:deoxyadenosine/deoxycytidine kinase